MLLKNVILLEYYCYEMKLVQDTKYLASHFCCFSGIMLLKNFEYLLILQSVKLLIRTLISLMETLTRTRSYLYFVSTECNARIEVMQC